MYTRHDLRLTSPFIFSARLCLASTNLCDRWILNLGFNKQDQGTQASPQNKRRQQQQEHEQEGHGDEEEEGGVAGAYVILRGSVDLYILERWVSLVEQKKCLCGSVGCGFCGRVLPNVRLPRSLAL